MRLQEEFAVCVHVVGVGGLAVGTHAEKQGDHADIGKFSEMRGAVSEEVFGTIVFVAFARIASVVYVEMVRVSQWNLPQHPAFFRLQIPESQPFSVTVETPGADGGRVIGIPPSITLVLDHTIEVGVAVQGIAYEEVERAAGDVGRQTERCEEGVGFVDLRLKCDVVTVHDIDRGRPVRDMDTENDVGRADRLADLEKREAPPGGSVRQSL